MISVGCSVPRRPTSRARRTPREDASDTTGGRLVNFPDPDIWTVSPTSVEGAHGHWGFLFEIHLLCSRAGKMRILLISLVSRGLRRTR